MTINELLIAAGIVKNATQPDENSATRIGGLFSNIIVYIKDVLMIAIDSKIASQGHVLTENNYSDDDVAEVAKIADKVNKVAGKGLSTNDFSNAAVDELAKMANKQQMLNSNVAIQFWDLNEPFVEQSDLLWYNTTGKLFMSEGSETFTWVETDLQFDVIYEFDSNSYLWQSPGFMLQIAKKTDISAKAPLENPEFSGEFKHSFSTPAESAQGDVKFAIRNEATFEDVLTINDFGNLIVEKSASFNGEELNIPTPTDSDSKQAATTAFVTATVSPKADKVKLLSISTAPVPGPESLTHNDKYFNAVDKLIHSAVYNAPSHHYIWASAGIEPLMGVLYSFDNTFYVWNSSDLVKLGSYIEKADKLNLMSITTAPPSAFLTAYDKYYNAADKLMYATLLNPTTLGYYWAPTGYAPIAGILYLFGSIFYVWDESSLVKLGSSKGTIYNFSHGAVSFTDNNTYYIGNLSDLTPLSINSISRAVIFQLSGFITEVSIMSAVGGTVGSAEDTSFLVHNNTTGLSAVITNSHKLNIADGLINYVLATPLKVTAGDMIQIRMVCPAWVTNPTTVRQRFCVKLS
jgi:hypothetical protein